MSKEKIAFQGEMGAYSHIACEQLFQDAQSKPAQHLKKLLERLVKMKNTK